MALDPRIPLGVQPIQQQPNMLGQYAQIMAIKAAQQEMQGSEEMRNLFAGGANFDDPEFQRKGYAANPRAFQELLGKRATTQKTEIEALTNDIKLRRDALGDVNTAEDYLKWHDGNHVGKMGSYFKSIGVSPSRESIIAQLNQPGGLEKLKRASALGSTKLQEKLMDEARAIKVANIGAGPGNRQAAIAEQRFNIEKRDRAELDALYGRTPTPAPATTPMPGVGGGGATSSIFNPAPTNVLANQVAPQVTQAPVNSLLNPSAGQGGMAPVAAPPGDLYAQIKNIDDQIAKLPLNNPKSIPIAQALNAQRTALLASAKQEFGGNQFDMTVPNPAKPGEFMTVKGRMDQYGRAVPVEIGQPPLSVDASATGGTTINPSVVRPAPRVGYRYNELGEEVKIPQAGLPEGMKLRPGERWNEEKAIVEQIPGSALYIEQQKKHSGDLNAVKTVQTTTKWGTERIDKILDPKNKKGFENSFGGYTAYATKELSGNTALVQSELASLKSDLKNKGLQMFRAGGSIGAMTEKEWPIIESMLATITPKMDVADARAVLEEVRAKFEALESLAVEKYGDQWQNTQYFKPVEKTTGGGGGGAEKTVTRTGTINGRKVVQYSDGSTAYAD
jgi:hypothetical protein